jgi:branched-chain amino acid transport system permease protein
MVGSFVLYYLCVEFGQNYFFALLLTIVIIGSLGIALEKGLFRPLRGSPAQCMVVSMGLMLLLEGGALVLVGPESRAVEEVFTGSLWFGGVFIPTQRLFVIGVSAALIAGLSCFLKYVKHGQAMRAFAQDNESALLLGISVDRMSWIGFAIGCALAGAAGALLTPLFFASFSMGGNAVLKGFIVMILGGVGSIPGALIGGLIIGSVESVGYAFIPGGWTTLICFVSMMLILLIRPQGIIGHEIGIH